MNVGALSASVTTDVEFQFQVLLKTGDVEADPDSRAANYLVESVRETVYATHPSKYLR